jgi:hypothetical protein
LKFDSQASNLIEFLKSLEVLFMLFLLESEIDKPAFYSPELFHNSAITEIKIYPKIGPVDEIPTSRGFFGCYFASLRQTLSFARKLMDGKIWTVPPYSLEGIHHIQASWLNPSFPCYHSEDILPDEVEG